MHIAYYRPPRSGHILSSPVPSRISSLILTPDVETEGSELRPLACLSPLLQSTSRSTQGLAFSRGPWGAATLYPLQTKMRCEQR